MVKEINQLEKLTKQEWDYLLVLDACRYDYFKKLYKDFFKEGKLEKVNSPASETSEWAKKAFSGCFNDIVYLSANPRINSKVEVKGFKANKHFHKVIDIWNHGWNQKLGTVHPKTVNESLKRAILAWNNSKKFIAHYIQPHEPYIEVEKTGDKSVGVASLLPRKFRMSIGRTIRDYLSPNIYNLVSNTFGLDYSSSLRLKDAKEKGTDFLKTCYVKNLKIALAELTKLLNESSEKIVITADHGEYLGECNKYGHPPGEESPHVREVPWFESFN
ncbi:hypothetical protein AKJ65_03655 [candidate division MSBL1 archaeon SCGC-AAA259E19]|uniref:Sulfatase N-terminal domain-containing protein n=1 Tax=candidate division MSBL1 archaeon SCGC-AAA259E19 TaxID=1698264 RepID=A0A133UKJ0_9EURY|nr:hypothetical protein AKJ65_03655 [candidate division MSBL1 archaeon SCGC-AAA259E19]